MTPSILQCIGPELKRFEEYFDKALRSPVPLLDRILTYMARQKGKQMRPMFVLLCARLGGPVNDRSHRAALFVELLHCSSLVHDDVVDEALERRSAFSVNALWKNKAAVLAGDHLFTKSVLLLLGHADHRVLSIFSDAIGKIIEGELLQMDQSRKQNWSEGVYYDIIKGKTATLLAASCAAGAVSTFHEEAAIQKLYLFGEKLGMAFQIRDDLLDYTGVDIGKPVGNDIQEKKVTLPLIYTLNHCGPVLRKTLLGIVRRYNRDKEKVAWLDLQVRQFGGIAYAEEKMRSFRGQALEILAEFPASAARSALQELVNYTTERAY
jgi:octaprenyl-diphosphate synthase